MSPELTLETERVDDIPLLLAQIEHMGLPALINRCFPPRRSWDGLDPGGVTSVWLAYILSRGDHRLSHVQAWVEKRRHTLAQATGQAITDLDWADDRLSAVLRLLSQDEHWQDFEGALSSQLLRVYDLQAQTVRIDTTSASGYWSISEGGLFQCSGEGKNRSSGTRGSRYFLAFEDKTVEPLPRPLGGRTHRASRLPRPPPELHRQPP